MEVVRVQCPAKINLNLEVLGKRSDGFHNIKSIMQTIDLFDYLTIEVEEAEDAIYNHDLTDMTDILREMIKEAK